MILNITANRDFNGTVTETVPDSFTITPATQSATQSYTDMQTVYLNSNDPAALMSQQIASTSGGLVMPFHGNYPITQGFGAQLTDPTLQAFYTQYGLAGHDGIDFGVPMGTPLYAVDEGDVIWSGPGDYGTMVTIQHSWGETYYGHMTNTSVTVGEHVDKGQLIGYSGMSGEATGPHLHFGMKPKNPDMQNGYYGKIDPMPFLPIGQGESISTLGPAGASSNPIASAIPALATTVLGASDSASPTPSVIPSGTSTPAPTAMLTLTPTPSAITPTPTAISGVSTPATASAQTVSVTSTPTPVPSVFAQPTIPANTSFTVLDQQIKLSEEIANNAQTEKVKILTWKVKLKKGESTSLGYAYQTPRVSPQFYLLGPAIFYAGGNDRLVFQEARQWQIASDDVGVEWYQNASGPHNWN
ncbi:MAG TPA: peptidoglycan DD-metalloendopeptidase family protein, partial [Bacteroidia bacterium]|nr:peptidoglycan DD-metalloendopeptidase family protein [Bacteroidia bacterium]